MFYQVLFVAQAVGAVSLVDGVYHVHSSVTVRPSHFDADFLGSLCVALGYDVTGESFGDVLCGLLDEVGDDFSQDEVGFAGHDEDGDYYEFLEDFD